MFLRIQKFVTKAKVKMGKFCKKNLIFNILSMLHWYLCKIKIRMCLTFFRQKYLKST